MIASRLAIVFIVAASARAVNAQGTFVSLRIKPSMVDSSTTRFDEAHYVVLDTAKKGDLPLLLFLPGTGGRPVNTSDFANEAAANGYRVVGLEYVDEPAVAQICPRNPSPDCSEKVRRKRIYGEDATSLIDDRPEESIESRLVALLRVLDRMQPSIGWSRYIDGTHPKWSRIAVSGLSQGAGMAAYIAQRTKVDRVVLFSSPWDNYGPGRTLAPWVTRGSGETPAERWFAAYHSKEATADVIARAYRALGIPSDHIHVLTLEPRVMNGANPYHASGVGNGSTPRNADNTPAYLPDWDAMLRDAH